MEEFNPNDGFSIDDIKQYKEEVIDKTAIEERNDHLNELVTELDSMIKDKVNSHDGIIEDYESDSIRMKVSYSDFELLKSVYESRGFTVKLDKVETGRSYVNCGDFYDTEFVDYDYYIVISWRYKY